MSLLKYVERLKRMDDLIKRKATGNARDFASKLKISESQLYQDLKEMRQLGAHVKYCTYRETYLYEGECRLIIEFVSTSEIKDGGENIFMQKM
jgi:predicted DNA-binding transcriptional regulator YafY